MTEPASAESPGRGASRRRPRRRLALALAVPAAFFLVWCALMRPVPRTVLAPLFGPFAGRLYGHEECTMASAWPLGSWGAAALGALALLAAWRIPRSAAAWILAALWSFAWSALAALSVVNSLE